MISAIAFFNVVVYLFCLIAGLIYNKPSQIEAYKLKFIIEHKINGPDFYRKAYKVGMSISIALNLISIWFIWASGSLLIAKAGIVSVWALVTIAIILTVVGIVKGSIKTRNMFKHVEDTAKLADILHPPMTEKVKLMSFSVCLFWAVYNIAVLMFS